MTHLLEQSDKEFKITIIIMLKSLEGNVDNLHKQMETFNREMETKRKMQMEMLQITIMVRDKECL